MCIRDRFVGGLLALFTPCVWPIIPMTVSFFLKRSKDKKKGLPLLRSTIGVTRLNFSVRNILFFGHTENVSRETFLGHPSVKCNSAVYV